MSTPWQILGLSQTEATEKDVKVAYAKLIKVHRPDSDPEGFQRVRAAYEQALDQLRSGISYDAANEETSWDEEPLEDASVHFASTPQEPKVWALPDAMAQARDLLHESILRGDRQGVSAALTALADAAKAHVAPAALVTTLAMQVFGKDLSLWITAVPMEFILNLVLGGEIQFAREALESWWKAGAFDCGREFAERLLAMAPQMVGEQMGLLLAGTGIYCGFWFPQVAQRLGQAAFNLLSPGSGHNLLQQLDQQVMLGRMFEDVPFEQRAFWRERLRSADPAAWNTAKGKAVIKAALKSEGPHWAAWGFVGDQLPGWARAQLRQGAKPKRPRFDLSRGLGAVSVLAFLMFRILAYSFSNHPTSHVHQSPPSEVYLPSSDLEKIRRAWPQPTPAYTPIPLTPPAPPIYAPPVVQPNPITAPFDPSSSHMNSPSSPLIPRITR